jgi:polyphosphate glucokinase
MQVLGVDIGGSGIKGAPVDVKKGVLLGKRFRIPTPSSRKPKAIAETVGEVVDQFKWNGVVGCGFPAAIQQGVALTAANVDKSWIGTDAARLISQTTKCKTYIVNDADAAGVAEMRFGAGRKSTGVVLMITVGTGLGTALFTDGRLVPNCELGHIILHGKDAEQFASDAARQRKKLSWKTWGRRFDEYLNRLESLFWPDMMIIGGGASKKFDNYAGLLTVKAKVVPAQMLNDAGIIGAAIFGYEMSRGKNKPSR